MSCFDDADIPTEKRHAGGAFAVAASPGGTRTFVPYLLKNDGSKIEDFTPGCYGNGADLPIAFSLAAVNMATGRVQRPPTLPAPADLDEFADFSDVSTLGQIGVVRAAFHDPRRSRVLVVGEGSKTVYAFDTSKADPTTELLGAWSIGGPAKGLVMSPDGNHVYVHRAIDGKVVAMELSDEALHEVTLDAGELSDEEEQHRLGQRLFYTADDSSLSGFAGASCSSCHLEGRTDGVTWRLDGKALQTPNLAGRTFPAGLLRWHGDAESLSDAIDEAISRVGGSGLDADQSAALVAYVRSNVGDMSHAALAASTKRGEEIFDSAGCTTCHDPTRDYSDGLTHTFRGADVRTPSLVGLALSAPYYHDGSAKTLEALLAAHEKGNPMAVGKSLNAADRQDLAAFLRTL